MFGHAPSQCTRAVAARLTGCVIPSTEKEIENMKKCLDGVLQAGEWELIQKALKARRRELLDSSNVYDSVSINKSL